MTEVNRIADNRIIGYPKSEPQGNDNITGFVVGQDNITGDSIVSDGKGNIFKGPDSRDVVKPLTKATAKRDEISKGSRDVTIDSTEVTISSGGGDPDNPSRTTGLTPGPSKDDQIDPCKPGQNQVGNDELNDNENPDEGGGELGRADIPEPPPNPTLDPFGGIDGPRLGATNTSSSSSGGSSRNRDSTIFNPPPEDSDDDDEPQRRRNPGTGGSPQPDPPSNNPPTGCSTDDDCQWYNGNDCPTGTSSRGRAELSDGSEMKLCCGSDRPPGDGCPDDETSAGYECRDNTCVRVPGGGIYATIEDCEDSGCGDNEDPNDPDDPTNPTNPDNQTRYDCIDGECVESEGGEFESLTECQNGGCDFPPLDEENTTYKVEYIVPADCNGFDTTCGNTWSSPCGASGGFYYPPYPCGYTCGDGELWDNVTGCTECVNGEKQLLEGKVKNTYKEGSKNVDGPIDRFETESSYDSDDNDCILRLYAIHPDGSSTGIASICGSPSGNSTEEKQSKCEDTGNKGSGYFSINVTRT